MGTIRVKVYIQYVRTRAVLVLAVCVVQTCRARLFCKLWCSSMLVFVSLAEHRR
jgi:hypothetical protein